MSTTIERLRKRLKWPVQLGDETVFIRGATQGEILEGESLSKETLEQSWFLFGVTLLNDDGTQAIDRGSADPKTFAAKAAEILSDVTVDQLAIVSAAITRVCTAPDTEKLKKN